MPSTSDESLIGTDVLQNDFMRPNISSEMSSQLEDGIAQAILNRPVIPTGLSRPGPVLVDKLFPLSSAGTIYDEMISDCPRKHYIRKTLVNLSPHDP
ncbi:hypothetical protein N7478_007108 [Penicillium angulare]|uniref:uncharacterized protein n=1 Tax=Penicillium angulare TaxID=116970 RepID=UPI002540D426|nr:uncharacterized protein N7478_007108 [Penicillium angulare]KAJ5281736.1 hypothetical protein N7478_007108 [Penicillium angulare]